MKYTLLWAAVEVLAGQVTTRTLLIVAALVGLAWMAIDYHQYAVFLVDRYLTGASEIPL